MIPQVAASERGGAQTVSVTAQAGLWDQDVAARHFRGTGLESPAVDRDSRVLDKVSAPTGIPSRAGLEKPCLNPAAPSAKAKYS